MLRNELYNAIERCIGSAYDLGHAHGMNVHRLYMRLPPQRDDEGWGQFVDTFVKYVQEEDANARDPGRDSNNV